MSMEGVEMYATEEESKQEQTEEEKEPIQQSPTEEILANLALVDRAVSTLEPRFTHRVLRSLTSLRKKLDGKVLKDAIQQAYLADSEIRETLLSKLPTEQAEPVEMDVEPTADSKPSRTYEKLPEAEVYLRLLIIHFLLANPATQKSSLELAHETVTKIQAWNRRSMEPLAARVYIALGRAYEVVPDVEPSHIRNLLLAAQRTASLRRDDDTLAAVINLLLRNYLHYHLYSQADKLVAKVPFPETANNSQLARYLYYVGRIRAVQLSYTEAHGHLQQAIRRAPTPTTAPGFYQAAHKIFVIVELLMGDIPERSLFRHPVLKKALYGYFEIVKAVRTGSLTQFQSTLATYSAQFTQDKTYTLILRLRQNVIKTGIRQLSLSYSRISLRDICIKLHLDSEEDAEYIVGKAIRDGVIEGRVVHKSGWLECGSGKGSYGAEVSETFGKRIAFCLQLHNESVKAMRYPLNAHRKELADADGAREREKELAKEIEDGGGDIGDLEGDDDIGGF